MATKQNNKSERVNSIQSLRDANKEVKSLSGVIKLLQKFWSNGYKDAFGYLGISYKDLDFKVISAMCQKNEDSQIYITSKKHKTNKAGQKVYTPTLITSGKNKGRIKDVAVYEDTQKVVTSWSATTLFKVLEQSKQK
ncbi:MAG: hypothetical protein II304_15105 [Bacteroidales bacterium]|nr:hypothetical protein [Bacteroidales bacterium]